MIPDFLRKIGGYLIMAASLAVAFFAVYRNGKKTGSAETKAEKEKEQAAAELKQVETENENTVKVISNKAETASKVSRLDPDAVDKLLRDEWSD